MPVITEWFDTRRHRRVRATRGDGPGDVLQVPFNQLTTRPDYSAWLNVTDASLVSIRNVSDSRR
ncbi:hypothetical protein BX591_14338 [Paraburkholderia bryophila]|uniref:Uncharacterized protein n=1 Tax=Paraburkholderia bryophila TaxID=420952 RepID=A0A329BK36_9BURK|nr:hypothetical protein BX591_14338 [Paraburkholderia bryophila]